MTFETFCLLQIFDLRERLAIFEQELQRARIVHEGSFIRLTASDRLFFAVVGIRA